MKGKKLLTHLGVPLFAATTALAGGCDYIKSAKSGLERTLTSSEVSIETINKIKGHTGQAANIHLNAYLVVRSQEEIDKDNIKYKPQYKVEEIKEFISLDNKTVLVPKPEDGEFDKDLYVRRVKIEKKKKGLCNLLSSSSESKENKSDPLKNTQNKDTSVTDTKKTNGKINSLTSEEESLPIKQKSSSSTKPQTSPLGSSQKDDEKETVFVRHYSYDKQNLDGKLDWWDMKYSDYSYKINEETGEVEYSSDLNKFSHVWTPVDAFGVYKIKEDGTRDEENLLIDQDIKITEKGLAVLKTKPLGKKKNGKYRIKVVTKYKEKDSAVKAVKDIRNATDWDQVDLFVRIRMSMGSLNHVYTGPDKMGEGPEKEREKVSLILSNYHVYEEVIEQGIVKDIPGSGKGVIRGYYMTLAAIPLVKFDERIDGEWLLANIYNKMYKNDLDTVMLSLENAIMDPSFPTVKFAKCDPMVGEKAIVVGHPLGLFRKQVNTSAVISDPNHNAGYGWLDMIAFYGELIGGNSGGGLYNLDGEYLGITSGSYVNIYRKTENDAERLKDIKDTTLLETDKKEKIKIGNIKSDIFRFVKDHAKTAELKEALKKEMAKELALIYSEEYKKPEGRVIVISPTGLDLTRKGTRIQEWWSQIGLDIGQPRFYDWSGNNSDFINSCGPYK